jgi:hypothetical protein
VRMSGPVFRVRIAGTPDAAASIGGLYVYPNPDEPIHDTLTFGLATGPAGMFASSALGSGRGGQERPAHPETLGTRRCPAVDRGVPVDVPPKVLLAPSRPERGPGSRRPPSRSGAVVQRR